MAGHFLPELRGRIPGRLKRKKMDVKVRLIHPILLFLRRDLRIHKQYRNLLYVR